ncbi:hypothetical protein AbraIFM66951_006725 [Aspergillus brasiliensis]|uniref:Putative 5'-nucleotidase C-terminal domain-containing protein n=1 Tax=Aspergillus brasiliensis TaxID=319629 RepID=A0A9W6DM16_9EURO|nr:hypothetical protein AbraCBS73388_007439 [Aspergillus brasiliensis]GKZ44521.1 hypothetical protein AbraIFM66951_006725 [Aspergillus brasiliensis]
MPWSSFAWAAALALPAALAQDGDADQPKSPEIAPRMQPDSHNTTHWPTSPLPWGELNFIHTTDTHGWLEGHLNEVNYGADWGDFVSFVQHMRDKADRLKVDLLVVDTGDIVTGNGLSDLTTPQGYESNRLFRNLEYDLLTIGNNDLYNSKVTGQIREDIVTYYDTNYLSSNVKVKINGKDEPIGKPYKHITTKHGLRITAFGFTLQDFKVPKNVTVQGADDIVKEDWFKNATSQPVDLYLLIGHADIGQGCKINGKYKADHNPLICMKDWFRKNKPEVPLQVLGGHSHTRNFSCYDSASSGLESGRYADTVGWLALRDVAPSKTWKGSKTLTNVPTPTKTCKPHQSTSSYSAQKTVHLDRRYLDFNRQTFAYHAIGAKGPDVPAKFDTPFGRHVTKEIQATRRHLNLTAELGCAPQSYYIASSPYKCPNNIYTLVKSALKTTVNNKNASSARLILFNTYGIRYDLYQGPFTVGDAETVSPYPDVFRYLANIPYEKVKTLECDLNKLKKSSCDDEKWKEKCNSHSLGLSTNPYAGDPQQNVLTNDARDLDNDKRNPGHVTKDDFGDCSDRKSADCGDDTRHIARVENYKHPYYLQVKVNIDEGMTKTVDVVFPDAMETDVLDILKRKKEEVKDYKDKSFTTREFLKEYAKSAWNKNSTCKIGQ